MRRSLSVLAAALAGTAAFALPLAAQAPAPAVPMPPAERAPVEYDASANAATVLARVGDVEITLGQAMIYRLQLPPQLQQMPAERLFPALVEQLIEQELLAQSLDGLDAAEQARSAVDQRSTGAELALTRVLDSVVTEESLETAYAAFSTAFLAAEPAPQFRASHILVREEAQMAPVVAALAEGRPFAEVATEFSADGSAQQGGDLGWFSDGTMIPEFQEVVVSLEPGEISEPFQTRFGWHVINLIETRTAPAPTLADVPPLEQVRDELSDEIRREAVGDLIAGLREAGTVENLSATIDPALITRADLFSE